MSIMDISFDSLIAKTSHFIALAEEFAVTAWNQKYAPEMLGTALGLLALLIIIRSVKKHFRPIRLFDNRAGVVEVSRKALDQLVQSVCYSLGALNRPDVEIYTRRGRLNMSVAVKLESGQKLTDATAEIQNALTSAFREHLGVEKLGKIDVKVTGFKGLIYKPTTKFLPPSPELDKNDDDLLLSERDPLFDTVDDDRAPLK